MSRTFYPTLRTLQIQSIGLRSRPGESEWGRARGCKHLTSRQAGGLCKAWFTAPLARRLQKSTRAAGYATGKDTLYTAVVDGCVLYCMYQLSVLLYFLPARASITSSRQQLERGIFIITDSVKPHLISPRWIYASRYGRRAYLEVASSTSGRCDKGTAVGYTTRFLSSVEDLLIGSWEC